MTRASETSPPLRFEEKGENGLLPVVVQDHLTGEIRMLAWANAAALRATLATRRATFFSRSRGRLWVKGESSGHTLDVVRVAVDCDADALVYFVSPRGPTCHTGALSCFFRHLHADGTIAEIEPSSFVETGASAPTILARLDAVLEARKRATAGESYTRSLYDAGPAGVGAKLREEADELARAVASEDDGRVASEAADVLFHVMVALRSRGLGLEDVLRELAKREGTGGHEDKRKRQTAV